MPVSVVVEDSDERVFEGYDISADSRLFELVVSPATRANSILRELDPYEDVIVGHDRIGLFIKEWIALEATGEPVDDPNLFETILRLARRVEADASLRLGFYCD